MYTMYASASNNTPSYTYVSSYGVWRVHPQDYFIPLYACVCLVFLYGDFMRVPWNVVYYGGDEEFVWVVVLGRWVADVVIYKVDVIQVVFEYVYVVGDVLGVG